ncbi:MAG: histidine kinase [Bacteroidales bacterium]|jgi:two-component system LytT family sensor kinase|nr:histidine kinase [Bacteroidales bacterium]
MIHPVVNSRNYALTYFALWIIPAILHMAALRFVLSFSWQLSALDTFISMSIFSLIGLSLWYVTFGIQFKAGKLIDFLLKHLTGLTVFLLIWLFVSELILYLIIGKPVLEMGYALRVFKVLEGILLYVTIITVFYLMNYYREAQRARLNQAILQKNLRESELRVLKSQINPHFLFNSLNSISALSITNAETARSTIIKLSDYLRYSLKMNPDDLVPLSVEIENCKRYLDIETVRFGDKMQSKFDVETECLQCFIPVLILQPLFENAVKHAVYESTEPIHILTTIRCDQSFLSIYIVNDFDPEVISRKGEGIGLNSIQSRLKLIYNNQAMLKTEVNENQFVVNLKIPVNYEN